MITDPTPSAIRDEMVEFYKEKHPIGFSPWIQSVLLKIADGYGVPYDTLVKKAQQPGPTEYNCQKNIMENNLRRSHEHIIMLLQIISNPLSKTWEQRIRELGYNPLKEIRSPRRPLRLDDMDNFTKPELGVAFEPSKKNIVTKNHPIKKGK